MNYEGSVEENDARNKTEKKLRTTQNRLKDIKQSMLRPGCTLQVPYKHAISSLQCPYQAPIALVETCRKTHPNEPRKHNTYPPTVRRKTQELEILDRYYMFVVVPMCVILPQCFSYVFEYYIYYRRDFLSPRGGVKSYAHMDTVVNMFIVARRLRG